MSQYRQGQRRPVNNGYPPKRRRRRRKKVQARFFVILLALALVIAAVVFGIKLLTQEDTAVTPVQAVQTLPPQETAAPVVPQTGTESLSSQLGEDDNELQGLTEAQQVKVENLNVTNGLPSEWLNVLLLGTDARDVKTSSRTDTIIICSINTTTGEVKLSSIARDTAIDLNDIGEYSGTYRINAANYFGGPELVMRTVNEKLQMNVENYVMVNFYGFQYIVQMMGGVDIDITEGEMEEINKWQHQQYSIGLKYGYDESGLTEEDLLTYGSNTHLNGRQALAYCRIRKLDSDFSRSERQRTVLTKLLTKLKGISAVELTSMALSMQQYIETNMSLDKILTVAMTVLGSDMNGVEQLRLPMNGTYVQETRKEQSMLYDCDWNKNALELYNFIYS